MGRPTGTPYPDHAAKRATLLASIRARLIEPDKPYPSMRELAVAAGVTVPTLRHYFGRRDDVVLAVMIDLGLQGASPLDWVRSSDLPFAESIAAYTAYCVQGLEFGVAGMHTLGLREGLRNGRLGPAYVENLLEPSLDALELRLAKHQAAGDMRAADVRHAALSLLSPILIAFLHQHELSGSHIRALDTRAFVAEHSAAFIRAYAV